MAGPEIKAPACREFATVPALQSGAMAEVKSFVANDKIQEAIGFPGKLADNWQDTHDAVIAKMGDLLGKYRSLKVFMDACVHCGSCTDKCHYFIGTGDPKNMPVARQDLMRSVYRRYFTEPVWSWVAFAQPFGMYAGFVMAAGLAGLWARRFLVERIRYISTFSDHLMLALLLAIAATGLGMKFLMHTDIVGVKTFFLGLMAFDIQPLPAHPGLYIHLFCVALLMIVFPFSKLLHAPGIFFSPTRNQTDNPREARHLAPWAAQLEKN